MAQITAMIASTTTMIVAAAVTRPMTTLKLTHAATSRTSSARARLPSEDELEGEEVDILGAYSPASGRDAGERDVSRSFGADARSGPSSGQDERAAARGPAGNGGPLEPCPARTAVRRSG